MIISKLNVRAAALLLASALVAACGGGTVGPVTQVIAGSVTGAVLSGVSLSLTGAATGSTATDQSGAFSFSGLSDGSYTVTPSRAGYTFSPAFAAISVRGADVRGTDFIAAASLAPHAISGAVSGATHSGVTVSLTGAASATSTTTTDSNGNYSFAQLGDGSYTVTPGKSGYNFSPTSAAVTVSGADITGRDFTATAAQGSHDISGTVSRPTAAGVTVSLTGNATSSASTDGNGSYSFTGLADGSYTVTPSKSGYSFSPSSVAVTLQGANVTGKSFTATALHASYTVSGNISGDLQSGVVVALSTGSATEFAGSDVAGRYTFTEIPNGTYMLTPQSAHYTFSPGSLSITVNGADLGGENFTASKAGQSISGSVSGAVEGGVTISLSGVATASTTTDGSGSFAFSGLASGSYKLTPSKSGYTFSPTYSIVTLGTSDVNGTNFNASIAAHPTHGISGTITGAAAGVSVQLSGAAVDSTSTDSGGTYAFVGLADGNYTVTPSRSGTTFSPASLAVTVSGADATGRNFSASTGSGGDSWKNVASGETSYDFTSVWGSTANDVWAVGELGTLQHWTGSAWSSVSGASTNVWGIWGSASNDVWAVGGSGMIIHWDGSSWSTVTSGTTNLLWTIWGSGPHDVWIAGGDAFLHWNGSSWSSAGTTNFIVYSLWGSGAGDVWAVGAGGAMVHWNGSSWSSVASGTTSDLDSVWASGPHDAWAAGHGGVLVHWNGSSWSAATSGTTNSLLGIWGSAAADVWAVGSAGTTLHWTGANWASVTSGTSRNFKAVWGSGPHDVWAVADYAKIYHYGP